MGKRIGNFFGFPSLSPLFFLSLLSLSSLFPLSPLPPLPLLLSWFSGLTCFSSSYVLSRFAELTSLLSCFTPIPSHTSSMSLRWLFSLNQFLRSFIKCCLNGTTTSYGWGRWSVERPTSISPHNVSLSWRMSFWMMLICEASETCVCEHLISWQASEFICQDRTGL